MSEGKNLAASVQARLLNIAKAEGRDYGQVLTKFALERLLYRLSQSKHADNFLLKGALLFDLWFDVPLRPTRDIDLLGFGLAELPHVIGVFEDLCRIDAEDSMIFAIDSIKAEEIRKAEPKLTQPQAFAKALELHPALYEQYNREQAGG